MWAVGCVSGVWRRWQFEFVGCSLLVEWLSACEIVRVCNSEKGLMSRSAWTGVKQDTHTHTHTHAHMHTCAYTTHEHAHARTHAHAHAHPSPPPSPLCSLNPLPSLPTNLTLIAHLFPPPSRESGKDPEAHGASSNTHCSTTIWLPCVKIPAAFSPAFRESAPFSAEQGESGKGRGDGERKMRVCKACTRRGMRAARHTKEGGRDGGREGRRTDGGLKGA